MTPDSSSSKAEAEAAAQQQQAADWALRTRKYREQEWDAALKLLGAAQCFLENFGERQVERMTLAQVSHALEISSRNDAPGAMVIGTSPLANTNRVHGWAEILKRLGDPGASVRPSLFFHSRCRRLVDCLPSLQHDPSRPEDVLKVDPDDDGIGGDDAADALRYLVAGKPPQVHVIKLRGL